MQAIKEPERNHNIEMPKLNQIKESTCKNNVAQHPWVISKSKGNKPVSNITMKNNFKPYLRSFSTLKT